MSKRPNMLASVIREIIAPVLRECPEECGIVSITEVEVSSDFSHATIFVSALKEPQNALAFLEKRKKQLQHELSSIHRARIPALRFRIDDRAERGERIDELLNNENL